MLLFLRYHFCLKLVQIKRWIKQFVYLPPQKQIERLKNRSKGYDDYYKELMSKQMPSNEKCDLADYVIDTTFHTAVEKRVIEILDILRA